VRRSTSPTAFLRQQGIYRGLLGGSRGWLVTGGIFWGLRFLRKSLGKNEEVAATEILKPGQAVTIIAIKPPTRAERKAAKLS
jgi:hypothetical protein